MDENYIIREATEDDAEKMITYLNQVGGESDNLMHGKEGFHVPVEGVKRKLSMCSASDNSVVLIALIEDEIIARAELEGYPNSRMHHKAKFSISVKKEYWNQGVGTKMMVNIIERAKEMNIKSIELEVINDNFAGITLYHKMGFADIGIYKDFWYVNGIYKDAIIMQKIL